MNRVSKYNEIVGYKTKDGSQIRELIHPLRNGNTNQSIAEARVSKGRQTLAHHHRNSEELYMTLEGVGRLYIHKGEDEPPLEIELQRGTNVVIRPYETHWLKNTGETDLVILCCCSPPYSHDDTFLAP